MVMMLMDCGEAVSHWNLLLTLLGSINNLSALPRKTTWRENEVPEALIFQRGSCTAEAEH